MRFREDTLEEFFPSKEVMQNNILCFKTWSCVQLLYSHKSVHAYIGK